MLVPHGWGDKENVGEEMNMKCAERQYCQLAEEANVSDARCLDLAETNAQV